VSTQDSRKHWDQQGAVCAADKVAAGSSAHELPMIGLKRGTVQLMAYQPAWRVCFEEEAQRLRLALGAHLLDIEHVGSTAIEDMDAKPIIDIMVAVESMEQARDLVPLLEALGYHYIEDDPVPDRLFLANGPLNKRTHHLSLTEPTSSFWIEHILFRDYLRTHPEPAEAYRKLKWELAQKYPQERAAYTAGKDGFIRRTLELASEHAGLT
jgi:GrpB-like predicted nucleotidyltransferase (UPF0157 family)